MQGIVHAVLLLLHLDFGRGAHIDDGDTAGELSETLLELLAVIVGLGGFNLLADLVGAFLDGGLVAGTAHDDGVLLGDGHLLGLAQHLDIGIRQREAALLADHHAAREGRDVLEHFLAAVTEARRLDGGDFQGAAQAVHHEGREGLAFDILGDDQEALAFPGHRLEHGHQVLHVGDLLVGEEDVGIVQDGFHLVPVGHEVRADVAAVELHALDHLHLGLGALGFLDGDDAVLLHLGHGLGDELADVGVVVGGDGTHLLDLGVILADRLALGLEVLDDGGDGLVDTALEVHRIRTGGDVLQTHVHDGLGEDRGGGGTVTGLLVGLGSDLLDHLGAHVLEAVLEFDLLGDGHAVLGDLGGSEFLVDDHVTAFRAQGHLYCVRKCVGAVLHRGTDVGIEFDFFCHGSMILRFLDFARNDRYYRTARMSDCLTMRYFLFSTVTSVPAYFP